MGDGAKRSAFFLLQMREGVVGAFCLVAEKEEARGVLMGIQEIAVGKGEQPCESENRQGHGNGVFIFGIDDAEVET